MTTEERFEVDPSWTGIIKWGGLSLFIAGVIVIVFVIPRIPGTLFHAQG